MDNQSSPGSNQEKTFRFNLGTFEGFNFVMRRTIRCRLSAADVVAWDHERRGDAEFWPSGDHPAVALLFKRKGTVTAAQLLDLDRLLTELGGDSIENSLRIHYAVNICQAALATLSAQAMQDHRVHVFRGTEFSHMRVAAAYKLFESCFPEGYGFYDNGAADWLVFNPEAFLDSTGFYVEEVALGEEKALLVVVMVEL